MLANRLLTGAASRVTNTALGVVIAFWMTPFLIGHLGTEAYGLWLLAAAITGFYGVLDLGISVATQRAIAQALTRGDVADANATVVTSFAAFCGVSLVILIVTVVVVSAGPLIVTPFRIHEFRAIVALLATSLIFLFPTYAVSGIFSSSFRYDIVSLIHLARILSRFALTYLVVAAGGQLISIALVTTLTDMGAGVAMLIAARRLAPWLNWSAQYLRRAKLRELFHFGSAFMFVTVCERGRNALPSLAVNASVGLTGVSIFGIAQQIYDYSAQFLTNIFGVLQPLFVRQQSAAAHQGNSLDLRFVTQLALAMAVIMASGVVACAQDFIHAWLGPSFERSLGPLFIFVITGVFYTSMQATSQVMLAYSMQKTLAALSACEILASIALLFPLTKLFGFNGVAVAMMAPAVVSRAVVQPVLVRREVAIDLPNYFASIARSCLVLLFSTVLLMQIRALLPGSGYLKALLMGVITVVVTVPPVYLFCLDGATRSRGIRIAGAIYSRMNHS
jgi:O-antigen/teichoic acid export membrane protein